MAARNIGGGAVPVTSARPSLTAVALRVRTRRTMMDVLPAVIFGLLARMPGVQEKANIALVWPCCSAAIASSSLKFTGHKFNIWNPMVLSSATLP